MDDVLQIKVDARQVLGVLGSLSRQAPYAISVGINKLMESGQAAQRAHDRDIFTVRREQFIDRTVKILQFAKKQTLTGIIGIDPKRDVLAKFEAGGLKKPRGSMLAVPIAVRRNKSDIVVKTMRVRELRLTPYTTKHGTRLRGLQRTFTVKTAKGGAILQRVGRKPKGTTLAEEIAAGSVRVAYAFKRSVPIPADLKFVDTMTKTAEREWESKMLAAWDQAQATAK